MKKELELKLVKNYPNLFKDYKGDPRETAMWWGFECCDGWYDLIDELSKKLEPLGVVAMQVKEKLGGLRFYIGAVDNDIADEVFQYISEAEAKSYEICELCGKPGKVNRQGWIQVRCTECNLKQGAID